MKTTIGGDRLGSGNKQEVNLKTYNRSTHDLSYLWRSSMASGTLVPFLSKVALSGDSWDIDLNCEVLTLPTVGPLFGSYKVQLDVFEVPMRLYNAKLHMNKLGVGMDMSNIFLPKIRLLSKNNTERETKWDDNQQVNPSSLMKYLGVSGLGTATGIEEPVERDFNAIPLLSVWDIYKNYYANKQEENGWMIHTDALSLEEAQTPIGAELFDSDFILKNNIFTATNAQAIVVNDRVRIYYPDNASEPNPETIGITVNGSAFNIYKISSDVVWYEDSKMIEARINTAYPAVFIKDVVNPALDPLAPEIRLTSFPLSNIDDMRESILQYAGAGSFVIEHNDPMPYSASMKYTGLGETLGYAIEYSQESLPLKTYQSDLFNNWISTEWIDGANGINEVTSVDTTGDSFTIDSLNLAQKVYKMLNRIAISGGTYDDWLDAVYTHQRVKGVESPVYHGSLIKELAFEEVISNADTENNPLGTLAGRGRLTNKNKGGRIKIKVNEPSYIIGLASITPRIDYSQGNDWDVNLNTYNDFHKPALDAIGYQDLITEQMLWSDTQIADNGTLTKHSVGKQPAWINYMTSVNKVYGNFADQNKDMFMVLNRRYEADVNGEILDATTYIDPSKFNHIFAQTSLDSQNFWVQISADIKARRKMSAKVIPNL